MRRLKGALDYETTVAPGYTDKQRSGINRTIETALARFHAVALLFVGGVAFDDVIRVQQLTNDDLLL